MVRPFGGHRIVPTRYGVLSVLGWLMACGRFRLSGHAAFGLHPANLYGLQEGADVPFTFPEYFRLFGQQ